MAIALPVNSQIRFKRQTAKGTLATASGAQVLRRETAMFNLKKDSYDTSTEIVSHQQLASNRLGARQVDGQIVDILSPGTFSDMISAVLRRDFAAVAASTGVSVTIAGTGPTYTVTRAAGSYLTDGYKAGMVVRLSVGTLNAANIAKNLLIISLTATVLTVQTLNGSALVAEGPIASTTVTAVGKVTYTPTTGHTNVYYTVETWDPDVPSSEVNGDVKIANVQLALPGQGNAKITIGAVGLTQTTSTSQYFTTPTTETTTSNLVGASGLLVVNGAAIATVTDLNITIDGGETPANPVVGSTTRPDIFRKIVSVKGTFKAYFDSRALADNFVNETSSSLIGVFTADMTAASDFIAISIPQFDTVSIDKDDGLGIGKTLSASFTAEFFASGGAAAQSQQTTLQIQDSAAP